MSNEKQCCVPNCNTTSEDHIPLHRFPNPAKDHDRFLSWTFNIGRNVLALKEEYVFQRRRVCRKHFEEKYHASSNTLFRNAIPTLHIPAILTSGAKKRILADITNHPSTASTDHAMPSSSKDLLGTGTAGATPSLKADMEVVPPTSTDHLAPTPRITLRKGDTCEKINVSQKRNLQRKIESYAKRLKKALKLSENITFQKAIRKFTTLAALFTLMQFREIGKPKMGRRFTRAEKIMALSLYKQGPRAYRWLSKIFILPSCLTLSRLVSRAGIKPGINPNIFSLLTKRAKNMSEHEKLCMVLFDEISLSPHFDYNRRKDMTSGFVNHGRGAKREIADHALVFMIRGVIKNYKQPICYTFCCGTTPKDELKKLIQEIISTLQRCGLVVLATVCDQGATNVSAINELIKETREKKIKENKEHRNETFHVNGKEIVPVFDTPHLIKGIRNNLLIKNLKCTMDGVEKTASWDHIQRMYEENPAYKGIRLIKNLTEAHVNPNKIKKMKVKYATQIFSRTVAVNMGYLADKGILPEECRDTADVLLFFDELFDSMNGSYNNSKKRGAKNLLGPVTPSSSHRKVWIRAKNILNTMKFLTRHGKEGSVPSIRNWLRSIKNIEYLCERIFNEFNFKSIWMRHFNQDPLENFFGCIRSHGYRNISPTPSGFESAFTSLLVTSVSGIHSPGSNCEEDHCRMDAMTGLFNTVNQQEIGQAVTEVEYDDLNIMITDINVKKNDPKIIAQLSYVTGYVLRKTKQNVFKGCSKCNDELYSDKNPNDYLIRREYFSNRKCLNYPSEEMIELFSTIQDIVNSILDKSSNKTNLKNYCKTIIAIYVDFNNIKCEYHKLKIQEYLTDLIVRFFICNWCRDVNKLLNGTRMDESGCDSIKKLASAYYERKNKKFK